MNADFPVLVVLAVAGCIVGSLCSTQVTRWLALVFVTSQKIGGDFLGAPKRRLLWALPFVAVLHPGFWLLIAVPIVTVRAVQSPSERLTWFLAGFYFFIALMALAMIATFKRARRRKA
ncbi:MAG TPA: hypothetical protein VGO61_06660 [Steroidobacteraceae bacterium]|jgi:hypothetical protein|nr:hypothetical protein [Steroidobacteraceae bacterium]